jgi:hypothetical protein
MVKRLPKTFKNPSEHYTTSCLISTHSKVNRTAKNTVKAYNFGPHGNFGLFLASSVASVDESCTKQ